jgi:hypothetical protein
VRFLWPESKVRVPQMAVLESRAPDLVARCRLAGSLTEMQHPIIEAVRPLDAASGFAGSRRAVTLAAEWHWMT